MSVNEFVIENGVLTDYKGSGGEVMIPDGVTEIGEFAFGDCKTLTAVTIPSSVTVIGENAFDGCENLSSLILPDSVKEIRQEAFVDCRSLADQDGFVVVRNVLYGYYGTDDVVNIPAGITEICAFAFAETDIVSVFVPEGVTHIGHWAFSSCSKLKAVALAESVKYIGVGAFCDCESLIAVTIPDGVLQLNRHVFQNCKGLTTVTVPESVKYIDESAFRNCEALKMISVPETLIDIAPGAFAGCRGLADKDGFVIIHGVLYDYFGQSLNVKIPDGVKKISRFYIHDRKDCVVSVLLPDSVTEIAQNAFDYHAAFLITIPASVTKIGEDALGASFRTLRVPTGSYAEKYVKENNIPYVLI